MYLKVSLRKQEYGFAKRVRSAGGSVFTTPEEIQGWFTVLVLPIRMVTGGIWCIWIGKISG
jgi:hypothetical protein